MRKKLSISDKIKVTIAFSVNVNQKNGKANNPIFALTNKHDNDFSSIFGSRTHYTIPVLICAQSPDTNTLLNFFRLTFDHKSRTYYITLQISDVSKQNYENIPIIHIPSRST